MANVRSARRERSLRSALSERDNQTQGRTYCGLWRSGTICDVSAEELDIVSFQNDKGSFIHLEVSPDVHNVHDVRPLF